MPEINFSEGVTKKLFGATRENFEDIPTETKPAPSSQEYFSKNVNLKFIEASNKQNKSVFPKLNIIQSENGINSLETIENSQININQSSPIPSALKADWRSHEFKNLLFDPNSSNSVFSNHLARTYNGLVYSRSILRPSDLETVQTKMVKLLANCTIIFLIHV